MTITFPSMTIWQRETIQKLFASDDENREPVPVAQLLASGVIEEITPLNEYLTARNPEDECAAAECVAAIFNDQIPEPGPQWDGYVVVLYGGHYMHVIDPWGGVNDLPGGVDGDIPLKKENEENG